MRLSEQSRLIANQRYLSTIHEQMAQLQEHLATGKRIHRASDDPPGASMAMQHRKNLAFEAQMRRNLSGGISFMNVTEAALAGMGESLQRVRELTVQASNDSMGPGERASIGAEVDELIKHMAQAANTRYGDAYIFSGFRTDTPAYDVVGDPPTAIAWQGDNGERVRRISHQEEAAINLVGDDVFGTMFDDLIALRDDLLAGASGEAISVHLDAVDAGVEAIIAGRAEMGARTNRFETALQQSEITDLNLQTLKRDVEEVDLADAITKLTSAQTSLEAAIGAIGVTSRLSLVNFLQ